MTSPATSFRPFQPDTRDTHAMFYTGHISLLYLESIPINDDCQLDLTTII